MVLVILLLGVALTLFGGTKQKRVGLELGRGDSYTLTGPQSGSYSVTLRYSDGRERTVASVKEPRLVEHADGQRTVFVYAQVNSFLDPTNLVLLAKDASFIAVMAVGMTAVIILAGIDLSVGSIYALSAMVGAMVLTQLDRDTSVWVSVPIGLAVCGLAGAICGAANGVMIVGLRVHPFVITLGTMAIFRGMTTLLPKEIIEGSPQSIGMFPTSFTSGFFKAELGAGLHPVPVVVMVIVGLIGAWVLSRTVFGRQVYAVGGNETAAGYAGIRVGRVKTIVYTVTGLLSGLSACMYLGYLGAAETAAGQAYELRVIAAAVIGGASLMGGRGSALGAVLGAIIIEMINNAMIILHINQDYNQVVMGVAIIVAVVIDQSKTRLGRSR